MKILIDADACPVVKITERVAKIYNLPVVILCDTNHVISSDYSEVKTIGAGADAVDFALLAICEKGDIVVSQDYALASLALSKGAYCIHQSGKQYTDENIDGLLMSRYLNKKARMASAKAHLKGPKKRTAQDDKQFETALKNLIEQIIDKKY